MLALDDLPRVQRELAKLKEEQSEAQGSLKTLLEQLKKEHKCSTEEEAEALVQKLLTEELRINSLYNKTFDAFKQEWKEKIPDEPE